MFKASETLVATLSALCYSPRVQDALKREGDNVQYIDPFGSHTSRRFTARHDSHIHTSGRRQKKSPATVSSGAGQHDGDCVVSKPNSAVAQTTIDRRFDLAAAAKHVAILAGEDDPITDWR